MNVSVQSKWQVHVPAEIRPAPDRRKSASVDPQCIQTTCPQRPSSPPEIFDINSEYHISLDNVHKT